MPETRGKYDQEFREGAVRIVREAYRRKAEQLGATGVVEFVERGEGLTR